MKVTLKIGLHGKLLSCSSVNLVNLCEMDSGRVDLICSAKEIAETLDIPLNSVYHLAKQPEWDTALNTLQYAGERAFKSEKRRDTLRDAGDLVARARELYLEQRGDSRTHKQAVSVVCETLDLKRRRVNAWAAKFGWEGNV